MASLPGFAAPKATTLKGFADAKPGGEGSASAPPPGQQALSKPGAAAAARAAAPTALHGFAAPKAAAAPGFAAPKASAPPPPPAVPKTGAAAIPPGRDGGIVPRGPRLSTSFVAGGAARQVERKARPTASDVCEDCGWRECQCAHKKVVRVVGPPLPEGARCRVCYEGPEDEALVSPCACRGDSAFAHVSCLVRWAESAPASTGGASSYSCPTCKTRYHGETARTLAVLQVDLSLDAAERAEDSALAQENVELACFNLSLVALRERTSVDEAFLKARLRKATRRARMPTVLAKVRSKESRQQKLLEQGAPLSAEDEARLRAKANAPAATAQLEMDRCETRTALAWALADRCVRVVEGARDHKGERQLLKDATDARDFARSAHADAKRICGAGHPDALRHFRAFGQMSMLLRYVKEDQAQRAKRDQRSDRLNRGSGV